MLEMEIIGIEEREDKERKYKKRKRKGMGIYKGHVNKKREQANRRKE